MQKKEVIGLGEYLTPKDIQEMLKISKGSAYNLMNSGHFKTIKIGKLKRVEKRIFLKYLSDNMKYGI